MLILKKTFLVLLIQLFSITAFASDREVAIVNSASSPADWIYFSGASPLAEWIYFSGPSPFATYIYITDDCEESAIELLKSPLTYADWIYLSGPSPLADWIYLSDPSPLADWYHITDKKSMAEITFCIPEKEMRTEKNIAILLHVFKKGKKGK